MLRRLRMSAGLTQERLAERSGISANGVAALEAGRRTTPRLNTVGLLADALGLDSEQRSDLIAAATYVPPATATPSILRADAESVSNQVTRREIARTPTPTTHTRSFVGRDDERRLLHEAWTQRTKVALLFGEAGVGKTALADEFAADLAASNVTVLRGRATPQQLGAYEAFVEPVRAALRRFDGNIPTTLRDLGRLVPGLIETAGESLVPSRSDPTVDRRLLFETTAALLAATGPTLLLLDDLHWADPGTLALLAFLASQPHLCDMMIVGTIRSTDVTTSTSAALSELRRHCTTARISLTGLNRAELAGLVSALAGEAISDALIDTVNNATNGNPLYVKELTEHLLQRGFNSYNEHLAVPEGIRATIELRVDGLSNEAQLLLRGAAVLGQTFDTQLAGQLVNLTGESFLGAVEDALLSGLLIEQSAITAAFSHGLVAATVYDAMPRSRRLVLHRGAATALTQCSPTTSAEIVAVARHWALVAEADPLARSIAARWSVNAGDAASSSAAIDEAIACYERAVLFWDEATTEQADTLVRLGSALISGGKHGEGNHHLQHALQIADCTDDAAVFARAALGLSTTVRYGQSDPERIAELEAAITKLGPAEMVLRPAVLATLRRQLGFVNTPEAEVRRRAAATQVSEAVLAPDVSDELVMAIGALRDSLVVDDPIPLGQLARKIVAVATRRQDLPALSTAWYRQAWSAMELGDAPTFRDAVTRYRGIAEQLGLPYELAVSANMIAAVAQIEGRYDDAEAAGQEALRLAATIEDANFSWTYFANSGLRAFDTGQGLTLEMMLAMRPDFAGVATFEASLVSTAGAEGNYEITDQLLAEQVGPNGEALERDWSYLSAERLPVVGLLAWGCGLVGNAHYAPLLLGRLIQMAALGVRAVRVAPVGAWIGPIDHHIGVLNRVLGQFDEAQRHLERALVVEDEMNGRPWRVRTLLELATLATARGDNHHQALASQHRTQAEWLAAELGLQSMVAAAK
jgi:transcriptional regulator with XRE-family HTH domain/tetratricopeptide (TPR) repeat protein